MNIKEIVTFIAKQEGLKTQVSVGNIREIVGIVSDLLVKDADALLSIVSNGQKRAARKKKK